MVCGSPANIGGETMGGKKSGHEKIQATFDQLVERLNAFADDVAVP